MLTESLNIYVIDKDGNKVTFPNVEGMQPAIVDVNLNRERMAGAPTNTSTLMYPVCLDDYWTKKEFIEIGSEKFYVKQVPTSEKNTEDARYKHEITFVSERDILENVFFFDCVTKDSASQIGDKPRTNTTDFSFFGDLNELVQRLNDSLSYSKIYDKHGVNGFCIVIDEDVEIGEAKEVSITDAYFATALQEIYNVFEVPYYWVGKICHVGYQENEIVEPFEYGSGNGLLSVQKNNADFRLINRITGHGSSDNIPYYYPNTDPNGIVDFKTDNIINPESVSVSLSVLTSSVGSNYLNVPFHLSKSPDKTDFSLSLDKAFAKHSTTQNTTTHTLKGQKTYEWEGVLYHNMRIDVTGLKGSFGVTNAEMAKKLEVEKDFAFFIQRSNNESGTEWDNKWNAVPQNVDINEKATGKWPYRLFFQVYYNIQQLKKTEVGWSPVNFLKVNADGEVNITYNNDEPYKLLYDNKSIGYNKSGFFIPDINSQSCDSSIMTLEFFSGGVFKFDIVNETTTNNPATITITGVRQTNAMSYLMPSVYRNTEGAQRFYNAKNETYNDEQGEYYSFNNEYTPTEPLEGKQDFDDIKPTINGITNEKGELFGEIAAVAFDDNDSDDLMVEDASNSNTTSAKPVHPYFYVKLHTFSGDNGFNLFKQGLAKGAMTFNFTTGKCAGCSFKVQVDEGTQVDNHYEFKNIVQVDEQGNLVSGNSDAKINASNPIESQQDTMTNEVWVALEKDNSTFGVLMPNATNNYRPKAGDKFVITNILLPIQYITAAENRLDAALIKYMSENNDEKFTFSIKFSRIYLHEHPEITQRLNENAKLHIMYNGNDFPLYVSSYSQKSDGNVLDEVTVELTEKLTIAQNKTKEQMKSIMDNIKSSTKKIEGSDSAIDYSQRISELSAEVSGKLSRVSNDTANGLITFLSGLVSKALTTFAQGARFGNNFVEGIAGEGGMIDGKGNAWLRNLSLAESLTVPKLSYNIVEICPGVQWQSAGGGTIRSVEVETDADGNETMNGIITLDLKKGEIGQVKEGDLCLGIFHSTLAEVNETEDRETETGIITRAGFYTCYFRITDIMEGEFNSRFRYVMRSDDEWSKKVHPSPQMTFVVFGNPDDESRQTSCYRATNYTRYLSGVTTWKMGVNNIACQIGDLGNLTKIQGYEFLKGYSGFFNSIYVTGHVEEIEDMRSEVVVSGIEDNRIEVGGSRTLKFSLRFQNKTVDGAKWKMVRESGLAEADAEWNAAHTDVSSPMVLTSDDMGDGAYLQGVMFTLTGSGEYRYVTGKTVAVEASKSMIITLLSRDELWIDFVPVEGKSFVVKASNVNTIVEARLMYGNADITDAILLRSSSEMEWTRDSGIKEEDNAWVATAGDTPNIIHIIDRANERHDCGSYWMQKLKVSFTFTCKVIFAAEPVTLTGTLGIGNQ